MRLPNLALVIIASTAAALPGRTPLDDCSGANNDQHPLASDNVICSLDTAKHPGHPFPEPPVFPPPSGHETIYTTLSKDSRFSRVVKAIDYIEEVAALLNNTSVGITFFAPNNKALRNPNSHRMMFETRSDSDSLGEVYDLDDVLSRLEALDQPSSTLSYDNDDDDDDDDQKERKRRFFKMLLRAILEYHILPQMLDAVSLGNKMTHPTQLIIDEALGGNPQRIRTEHKSVPSILAVNLYSHIVRSDIKASNGLIHVVNHPLFPPPSAFQELFMAPSHFSVFTSAIQRTGLADALDFRFTDHNTDDENHVEGTRTVTVFAPTNKAFEELPKDLQLFLFSPFGERVLRRLLQYHIVPDYVLHSDYMFNNSGEAPEKLPDFGFDSHVFDLDSELRYQLSESVNSDSGKFSVHTQDGSLRHRDNDDSLEEIHGDQSVNKNNTKHKKSKHPKKPTIPCPEPISLVDFTLPTLYKQHSLHIHIGKFKLVLPIPHHDHPYRIITKFTVNGHRIRIHDLVAMNGAVHVIDKLLDPRGPHRFNQISGSGYSQEEMENWKSWKMWLYEWAEM